MNRSTSLGRSSRFTQLSLMSCALIFVLLITLLLIKPSSTVAAEDIAEHASDFSKLDAYIESEMQEANLPGLALGIVQGDQTVYLKGYGNTGTGADVTPQTPFLIGSTGKSFTALAIMQLVEDGRVELDAPVQRYIPWFRVTDNDDFASITVRHLLNHTSGISTAAGLEYVYEDTGEDALERRVRSLADKELSQPVGAGFQYSNANYETLGLIVQVVSGQSYDEYIAEHILKPLNMNDSFLSPVAAREHGAADGHRFWFGQPIPFEMPYNRALIPAGLWWSSAQDLTHYLIAQLNAGQYEGMSLLSPAGIKLLHQPAVHTPENPIIAEEWYGMGWFIRKSNSLTTISHAGSTPNFHANLVLIPEGQWGIVLLMNGENGLQPTRIMGIAQGVTTRLTGHEPWQIGSNDFFFTLMTYILIAVALQMFGMLRSILLLRRWQRKPQQVPQRIARKVTLVPSSILNLTWAGLCLLGLPTFAQSSLSALRFFIPDFGWVLTISGSIALVWAILRPILIVISTRGGRGYSRLT